MLPPVPIRSSIPACSFSAPRTLARAAPFAPEPFCRIPASTTTHVIGAHSVLDSCRVGPKAQIGPFSRLRPGSDIRAGAHVGSFVEMKKTVLHEGAKAPHLSYLGDATIGRDTNIGAGTITCNYDGTSKHPTIIGSRVFIGSDTALVAPVRVGDGAYVAAGSVITDNVPADALGIGRGRQVNKPGWAAARRKEMQRAAKQDARSSRGRKHRTRPSGKSPARASRARSTKASSLVPPVVPILVAASPRAATLFAFRGAGALACMSLLSILLLFYVFIPSARHARPLRVAMPVDESLFVCNVLLAGNYLYVLPYRICSHAKI